MIVELHGGQFENKGSELMLRTVVSELTKRMPSIRFAVSPAIGSYRKRSELQLLQIFPSRPWMGSEKFQSILRRQKLLNPILGVGRVARFLHTYGMVSLDEVDALVDLSGFAFSDQWGNAPTRDYVKLAKTYKDEGKPVVMLPQAFGPFGNPEIREDAIKLVNTSDLVYARDQTSLSHLHKVGSKGSHVKQAPDMTLFFPETLKSVSKPEKPSYSCIIPNVRMLEQGKNKWGGHYEDVLVNIGDWLSKSGEKVRFLIHDTSGKDIEIANRVRKKMKSASQTVKKKDPIKLKKFISKSRLVVTSRYHGAIASFSKGVPSLCLGWSHKYEMLYNQFDCSNNIIKYTDSMECIKNKLNKLLRDKMNQEVRKRIIKKIGTLKNQNKEMWEDVVEALN